MVRRFVLLSAWAVIGVGVVGCSSPAVRGQPTAQRSDRPSPSVSSAPSTVFNSCADLTEEEVRSFGLDPATKTDKDVLAQAGQFGCSWDNAEYSVSIFIQDVPPRAFLTNPALSNVTEINVGTRTSFQASDNNGCDIAIPVGGKGVVVGLVLKFDTYAAGGFDSCGVDRNIANKLVMKLPK